MFFRKVYPDCSKPLKYYSLDIIHHPCISIIMLEGDVWRKLIAMILGFIHYIFSRYGSWNGHHQ